MVGRTVDHYQFVEKLGSGGMGDIYKAQDTRLHRFVAIKVLTAASAGDPERRRRFIQEAQAASALNHPNIITIHDIVSEGDTEFMVMEFVAGKTLVDLIPKGGMTVPQVLKYSVQMADALQAAHNAGIVHRDLKPANVMVTESGLVKILDFGLAKISDPGPIGDVTGSDATQTLADSPLTVEGSILGTVSYMSPEQAQGKKVDTRSDIFSFGVVLYEMATGERAFAGDNAVTTLSAILRDEVRRMTDVSPEVPPQFEMVISRCLKKIPDQRWQAMKDVQMALAALKHESDSGTLYRRMSEIRTPGSVPPRAASAPASSAAPSHGLPRAVLASALGGVVLLGAIAGGVWWAKHRQRAQPPAQIAATTPAPTTPPTEPQPPAAEPAPAPPAETVLTNDSIIELAQGKVPSPVIISQIRSSKTNFNLTPSELVRLTKAQVPESVIEQMQNPKRAAPANVVTSSRAPTPAPAPAAPSQPAPQQAPQTQAAPQPVPAAQTPPPPQPTPAPAPKAAPASVTAVTLNDAFPFSIALAEDIPDSAEENRPLRFTVTSDVRVGDYLVIAKGSTVLGAIAEVPGKKKKLGLFGGGKMTLKLTQATGVDGHKLNVRALAMARAEGSYRQVETGAPRKSKDVIAAAGTEYFAYLDGTQTVSITK